MHIPSGYVSEPMNAVIAVVAGAVLTFCVSRMKREKGKAAPIIATVAGFVFAAQMAHFSTGVGASGHFLGALTAAVLLGPWCAGLVLSGVLVLQSVVFGDGGLSALGCNILNMAVIGGIASYPLLRGVRKMLPAGRAGFFASAALASWASVVMAAVACALELALSGTSPAATVIPAMVGAHALIGVGEAVISVAVLMAVAAVRPDILPGWAQMGKIEGSLKSVWGFAYAGLALAVLVVLSGAIFGSTAPDGLEKVAAVHGFLSRAVESGWAPFADYRIAALRSETLSTSAAGFIGILLAFVLGLAAMRVAGGRQTA